MAACGGLPPVSEDTGSLLEWGAEAADGDRAHDVPQNTACPAGRPPDTVQRRDSSGS